MWLFWSSPQIRSYQTGKALVIVARCSSCEYQDLIRVVDPFARLMTYGLSLACRGVKHHSSGELFASRSRDAHGIGTANIHAGSALLATGGICLLGDLSCYKKEKLDALQSGTEALVQRCVSTTQNLKLLVTSKHLSIAKSFCSLSQGDFYTYQYKGKCFLHIYTLSAVAHWGT